MSPYSHSKPSERVQKLRTKLSESIKNCRKRLETHPMITVLFIVLIILAYFMEREEKPAWWDGLSIGLTRPEYPFTILLIALALTSLAFGRSWLRRTGKSILWLEDHWKLLIPFIPLVIVLMTLVDYIHANRNTAYVSAVVVRPEGEKLNVSSDDGVATQYQVSFNNINLNRDGLEFTQPDVPAFIKQAVQNRSSASLEEFKDLRPKCRDILAPTFITIREIEPQSGQALQRPERLQVGADKQPQKGQSETLKTGDRPEDKLPIKTSVGTVVVPLRFLKPYIGYREVKIQITLISHSPDTENIRIDVEDGKKWSVSGPRQDWLQLMNFLAHYRRIHEDPETVPDDSKANLALSLGNASFKSRDYLSALAYYRLADSFRPNDDNTTTMIALSHYRLGNSDEAAKVLEEYVNAYGLADSPINVYLACMYGDNDLERAEKKVTAFNDSLKTQETPEQRMAELDRKPVIGSGSHLSVNPDLSYQYYIAADSAYSVGPTKEIENISQDIGEAPRQVFAIDDGVYYLTRDGLVYFLRTDSQPFKSVIDEERLFIDREKLTLSNKTSYDYSGGIRQLYAKGDILFLVDRFGRILRLPVGGESDLILDAVGWEQSASQIFLDDEALYILRDDGTVARFPDAVSGDLKDPKQLVTGTSIREIAVRNGVVYMLAVNGNIWRYLVGQEQEDDKQLKLIDAGTATEGIIVASQGLFVLKDNGDVWLIRNPANPTPDDVEKLEDIQPANRVAINVTGSTMFALEGSDSENLQIVPYELCLLKELGCPIGSPISDSKFAEQHFERGSMVWVEKGDLHFALYHEKDEEESGKWVQVKVKEKYPNDWKKDGPSPLCGKVGDKEQYDENYDDENGPISGFSVLWCAKELYGETGPPLNKEHLTANLFQEFKNGYLLRDSQGRDYILARTKGKSGGIEESGTYVKE